MRAGELGEVVAEALVPGHDQPVQRSVKAASLTVHSGREHGANFRFRGEQVTVEIRHR
jgi:hypothetical protein